ATTWTARSRASSRPSSLRARSALALGGAIALAAAVPRFLGLEVGRVYAGAHPDEVPVALAQWALDRREPSWFLVAYGGGYHTPLQRDSARGPRGRPSVGRAAHGTGDARNRYARARAGLDRSERAARRADRRVWRPAEQRVGAARSRAAQAVARDRSGAVAHRGGLARFTGVLRPGPRIEIYAVGRVQGESR